jgi:hypothetical protein
LKEVEQFNDIINKIQQKFPEQFSTQEQVFDVFASAYFSGRLLPVARLIEKTFGSGSFRKIGEETKKVNK